MDCFVVGGRQFMCFFAFVHENGKGMRIMPNQRPLVIAHRGAKGMAPENTLGAFQLGVEQKCDAIELDVHLSSDGEIIVCHDETLDRTTNGEGRIIDKELAEIRTLDAGSWYSEAYRGEKVPTLGEVFDLVPSSIMVNVEVKNSYDGRMEERLIAFMRERDLFDQVVVSSFDHKYLYRIKVAEPKVKIGLLYQIRLHNAARYAKNFGVDVYSLHPYFDHLDKDDVEQALQEGLQVYPWTPNEQHELEKVIGYGASGIITDFPARLDAILSR